MKHSNYLAHDSKNSRQMCRQSAHCSMTIYYVLHYVFGPIALSVNNTFSYTVTQSPNNWTCVRIHAFLPVCKREWGTTRRQGGLVSLVSRGEWPGRRLHRQGLKNEKRGGGEIRSARLDIPFLYTNSTIILAFHCNPWTVLE